MSCPHGIGALLPHSKTYTAPWPAAGLTSTRNGVAGSDARCTVMPLSHPMSVHTVEMLQAQTSVPTATRQIRRKIENQSVNSRLRECTQSRQMRCPNTKYMISRSHNSQLAQVLFNETPLALVPEASSSPAQSGQAARRVRESGNPTVRPSRDDRENLPPGYSEPR